MKHLIRYIIVGIVVLCMAGCHTQKTATRSTKKVSAEQELAQKVIAAQPIFQTAEASKVRVGVSYAGQKISVNGSITVITDSIIVLSVQPLLGIEMFRVDLTPQQILVVDKMNRKYTEMSYAELGTMTGLPLSFDDLQAVFLNRMFVMGKEQSSLVRLPFTSSIVDQEHRLNLQDKMLNYTFGVAPKTYALTSTQAGIGSATAQVKYVNHSLQDEVYFPMTFLFKVNDGKNNITECELSLLKVRFNQDVKVRTADLSRYTKTTLKKMLSK